MYVAYEYFFTLAFPRRQRASTYAHTHTYTHTQTKAHGNVLCEVHAGVSGVSVAFASDLLEPSALCMHFASVKKSCTDISVCVQPFQVNFVTMMRNAYIAAVFVSDAFNCIHALLVVCMQIESAKLAMYGREVGLFGTRAMKVKFASRYM